MTITQTVEIPSNHRVFLELPPELPVGRAHITITPDIIEYPIYVVFDEEAQKWYAQNDDIPIILEDNSLDLLINRIKLAAPEILELNNLPYKNIKLLFRIETNTVTV